MPIFSWQFGEHFPIFRAHIVLDGDERNLSKSCCTPVKNHLEVQAGHVNQQLQRKDPQLDWSSDCKGSEKLFEVVSEWVLAADQAIYQERVPSSGNQQTSTVHSKWKRGHGSKDRKRRLTSFGHLLSTRRYSWAVSNMSMHINDARHWRPNRPSFSSMTSFQWWGGDPLSGIHLTICFLTFANDEKWFRWMR